MVIWIVLTDSRCRRPISGFRTAEKSAAILGLYFLANHIMEDRLAPWRESQEAAIEWQKER